MALRRSLANRILQQLTAAQRSHPCLPGDRPELPKSLAAHRRIFLKRRLISQSAAPFDGAPPRLPFPVNDDLIDRIHSSIWGGRIELAPRSETKPEMGEAAGNLRISSVQEAAMKLLGHSGGVVIFLRPDQVGGATELAKEEDEEDEEEEEEEEEENARRSELRKMEEEKAAIDRKAEAQVRKEMWVGLGLMVVQTVGFMRLTFWELSWDVMEPICFFTSSIYFMMGYAFFMRATKEPSFEGFFAGRFAAKQKRLIKAHRFDLRRFNALRKSSAPPCDCCHCRRDLHRRSDDALLRAAAMD